MPRTLTDNHAFYDRISHAYDAISDASEHRARECGEASLQIQPGWRILEIGAGTGNSLANLAAAVGPQGDVVGLDISSGMIQVAARKVAARGPTGAVRFARADGRRLPLRKHTFDAAFLSFTLELFSDDDITRVLAEIQRVLKPGGRLASVSMALARDGEHESMLEHGYRWMHRHFPHIVDCRPIDAAARLQDAGFTNVAELRMDMWTMPVAAVVGVRP